MTVADILKACKGGVMPTVRDTRRGDEGRVVVIKNDRSFTGIAVAFSYVTYNIWYYEQDQGDKRKRHMGDLEFCT